MFHSNGRAGGGRLKHEGGRMKTVGTSCQPSAVSYQPRAKPLNTKEFRLLIDDCRSKAQAAVEQARTAHAHYIPASQGQADETDKWRFVPEKESHHAMIVSNICSVCQCKQGVHKCPQMSTDVLHARSFGMEGREGLTFDWNGV